MNLFDKLKNLLRRKKNKAGTKQKEKIYQVEDIQKVPEKSKQKNCDCFNKIYDKLFIRQLNNIMFFLKIESSIIISISSKRISFKMQSFILDSL